MPIDLTPLERAAARVGLHGLTARIVTPDRRVDQWFAWNAGELRVSERIVERLRPEEAEALLVNTVLRHRLLTALVAPLAVGGFVVALATLGVFALWPSLAPWAAVLLSAALLVGCAVAWGRATLAADDATVELLGDAEVLCRTLNRMNQDELRVGRRRVPARPDLHRRAERLVSKHQLRLPPELRGEGAADHGRA